VFLALISVECVRTHIYVGGVVLQAYSSYAFTHSLLSISGFLCSHSLLLFLSLSFLSYVFIIHSSWRSHTEQSNKGEASHSVDIFLVGVLFCRLFSSAFPHLIDQTTNYFVKFIQVLVYHTVSQSTI
jgi:hypothetical protein